MPLHKVTPNQTIAFNLKRARTQRGWTQERAAEKLEPYLGERWSSATLSVAERSIDGKRVRQFTADDIFALARGFDLPINYFFRPPTSADEIGHARSSEATPVLDYLDMLFDVGEDAAEWVLKAAVPMTAQTTLMLRRWGKNFAEMVAHREAAVEALFAVKGGPDGRD